MEMKRVLIEKITFEEFKRGIKSFRENEKRDAMYKVATYLVQQLWPKVNSQNLPLKLSEAIGLLLLTWNWAFFYRYGFFDFSKLENCIVQNYQLIDEIRNSKKLEDGLTEKDEEKARKLFLDFSDALRADRTGTTSSVATAKTLHLLAPFFFPLWDQKIASAYVGRNYNHPEKYLEFMHQMREFISHIRSLKTKDDFLDKYEAKSLKEMDINSRKFSILKLIDEFNYSKFTKKWI